MKDKHENNDRQYRIRKMLISHQERMQNYRKNKSVLDKVESRNPGPAMIRKTVSVKNQALKVNHEIPSLRLTDQSSLHNAPPLRS